MKRRRGVAIILYTLLLPTILMLCGLGIDLSMLYVVQTRLSSAVDGAALADYAGIIGPLLAKGHARTSGASMIVGYAGSSDRLDVALARFARRYADQTEADHAALVKAANQGIVPIERGL